jgi:hypothetical protein
LDSSNPADETIQLVPDSSVEIVDDDDVEIISEPAPVSSDKPEEHFCPSSKVQE